MKNYFFTFTCLESCISIFPQTLVALGVDEFVSRNETRASILGLGSDCTESHDLLSACDSIAVSIFFKVLNTVGPL
jgi:hypothetical protein